MGKWAKSEKPLRHNTFLWPLSFSKVGRNRANGQFLRVSTHFFQPNFNNFLPKSGQPKKYLAKFSSQAHKFSADYLPFQPQIHRLISEICVSFALDFFNFATTKPFLKPFSQSYFHLPKRKRRASVFLTPLIFEKYQLVISTLLRA